MKINKHVLNRALRVLGKMVCQTSPVELYRSISNAGLLHPNGVSAFNRCHCYRVNAPRAVLTLDREILLRMLLQGYTTFNAHSDGLVPVVASGGAGQPVVLLNVSA